MTIDILWSTILDPRCRSLKHLSAYEREASKDLLIHEVLQVFQSDKKTDDPNLIVYEENEPDFLHKGFDIFDSPLKNTTRQEAMKKEKNRKKMIY
jgi:hypothetical protein